MSLLSGGGLGGRTYDTDIGESSELASLGVFGSEATGQSGAWVDVNGARLYYERSGSGAEVVLILIHEFSLDHLSSRWV